MNRRHMTRRRIVQAGLLGVAASAALAGCGETQVVTETKVQEVVKEVPVEKVVTREVVKEVVVEKEKERVVKQTVEVPVEVEVEVEKVVTVKARVPRAEAVNLSMLTHWGSEESVQLWHDILDEYEAAVPNARVEYQTVPFSQMLTRVTTGHAAGNFPDMYHYYNLWTPDFAPTGFMAEVPRKIKSIVDENWAQSAIDGASYQGKLWGFPTEVNAYLTLYNKRIFDEAGVAEPPTTWEELLETAARTTKTNNGAIEQAGYLWFMASGPALLHPWISYLWSNNGQYLDPDTFKLRLNEPPSVETVQMGLDLVEQGSVDLAFKPPDFISGNVAMFVGANWRGGGLRNGFADGFENVGVGPIPTGPRGSKSVPIGYNWLWGVDSLSKNAAASWDFLTWVNGPRGPGQGSPQGEFMSTRFNIIPSRLSDLEAFAPRLSDDFFRPFVKAIQESARPQPIMPGVSEVTDILHKQMQAVFYGETGPQTAMDKVVQDGDAIIAERMKG